MCSLNKTRAAVAARARATAHRARAGLVSIAKNDAVIFITCISLICFGCWLRLHNLDQPSHMTFDEDHFVKNAQNYLAAKPDWNDHPPLGKLLMATAMLVAGDNGTGWRLVALLSGLTSIALGYAIGFALFRQRVAGWLAAAFLAADGFFIAYSRTALLDGILTALVLASVWTMVRVSGARQVATAALLAGLACSIKISGIVLAMPLVLVRLISRRAPLWSLGFLALIPLVYYLQYALGFYLTGLPFSPLDVWNKTQALATHHMQSSSMVHPASSHWYSWLLPTTPITLRTVYENEPWVRTMSTMGNPLLWWAGSGAVICCAAGSAAVLIGMARRASKGLPRAATTGFVSSNLRAVLWLLLCWLAPLLPWILTSRDSYVYHYLPSYAFALILLAGFAAWLYQRRRRLILIAVLLVADVSVYYAPIWSELPVTREGVKDRLFFRSWR